MRDADAAMLDRAVGRDEERRRRCGNASPPATATYSAGRVGSPATASPVPSGCATAESVDTSDTEPVCALAGRNGEVAPGVRQIVDQAAIGQRGEVLGARCATGRPDFKVTVRPLELISVWPSGVASRPPSTGPIDGYDVVVPRPTEVIDKLAEVRE